MNLNVITGFLKRPLILELKDPLMNFFEFFDLWKRRKEYFQEKCEF